MHTFVHFQMAERRRESEHFYLWIHSWNAHNGWGWSQEQGTQSPTWVARIQLSETSLTCWLPGPALARSWNWKMAPGIKWTSSDMGHVTLFRVEWYFSIKMVHNIHIVFGMMWKGIYCVIHSTDDSETEIPALFKKQYILHIIPFSISKLTLLCWVVLGSQKNCMEATESPQIAPTSTHVQPPLLWIQVAEWYIFL